VSIDNPTSGVAGGWVTFAGTGKGLLSGFTGNVIINSGVLAMDGATGEWSPNANLTVNSGGLFGIRYQSLTVASLAGSGDIFNSYNAAGAQGARGAAGDTLTVNNASANTFSGVIHGNIASGGADGGLEIGVVNLVKTGAGTLTLTGANTYSGTTTISAGTLQIGTGGTSGVLGSGAVNNNSTLVFNRSDSVSVANVISGTGALTQSGSGTVTLSGANTYTGATNVNAGSLKAGSTSAFGSNSATTVASGVTLDLAGNSVSVGSLAGAGTVTNNGAAATLTNGGLNASTTFSGVLQDGTGALGFMQTGSGTLYLSGASTFTGALTIAQGGTTTSIDLLSGASLLTSSVNVGTGSSGASNVLAILRNRANNQMTNAVVTLNGANTRWVYWLLEGTDQNVKGIVDTSASGVVGATNNLNSKLSDADPVRFRNIQFQRFSARHKQRNRRCSYNCKIRHWNTDILRFEYPLFR